MREIFGDQPMGRSGWPGEFAASHRGTSGRVRVNLARDRRISGVPEPRLTSALIQFPNWQFKYAVVTFRWI